MARTSRADIDKISRIYQRFDAMRNSRQALGVEAKWLKYEKQYAPGIATRDTDLHIKNPSKIKSSMTWANIQTVLAMMIDQKLEVELMPQEKKDRAKALVLQAVFDFAWEKSKGNVELFYFILSALVYGTGIWKEFYRSETRKIKEIDSYDPTTETLIYKETTIEDYNDVDGENVDIRKFYVDDEASDMENARDCIERSLVPFASFTYQFPKEKYQNVSRVTPGASFLSDVEELREENPHPDIGEDRIEILEYWNKERDERVILANGVIILDTPNPYKHKQLPYARLPFYVKDKQNFYGVGIAELLEHPQATMDTVLNLMIDRMKLALNKPIFTTSAEDIGDGKGGKVVLEMGKVVVVNDIAGVREFDIDPPDQVSLAILEKVESEPKYLIGIDDPQFGVKSGGTATENAIAKESSLRKMKVFLLLLENEALTRIARLRIANIQQFYSQPLRIERVAGKTLKDSMVAMFTGKQPMTFKPIYRKFPLNLKKQKTELGNEFTYVQSKGEIIELQPEDYEGYYDVKVKPNSSLGVSKALAQSQDTEFLASLGNNPVAAKYVNWKKLLIESFYLRGKVGEDYVVEENVFEDKMNDLAEMENNAMMQGQVIQPTGGATIAHSERHFALINSEEYKNSHIDIQKMILQHYDGELAAHERTQAENALSATRQLQAGSPSAEQATSPSGRLSSAGLTVPTSQAPLQGADSKEVELENKNEPLDMGGPRTGGAA